MRRYVPWVLWVALVVLAQLSATAGQTPAPRAGAPQSGLAQPALPTQTGVRSSNTGTARLRVRVVSDTGAPVRDAEVTLIGPLIRQGKTDEEGRHDFASLPAGRFSFNATKSGFAAGYSSVTSPTLAASVELSDGQTLDRS